MNLLFAWRYFKAKKSANAINVIAWVTVGVIAFATACQILVLSVFNGFEDLVKSLYTSFYTDIKVTPTQGKTCMLSQEQINQIKNTQGVSGISLVAEEKALIKNQDIQTVVYLKGVDDNYANVCGVPAKINEGKFNTGTASNPGLIVGYGIQNAAAVNVEGMGPASSLTVLLPKKNNSSFSADPLESLSEGNATATGVFAIQQDFDNKYVFTNIDFVKQQLGLGANEYSAVEIKTTPKSDIKLVCDRLAAFLPNNTYNIQTKYQQNVSLYNTMQVEKWFIYCVLTLILIIAAFNMISALTMLVLEKQKDIAILKSLGADKSLVLKIFLSEGFLLVAIGAAIGISLAVVIGVLQINYKFIKLEGGSFLIDYFPVRFHIQDFLLVTFTAACIALIAAWIPSQKAASQKFIFKEN